MRALAILTAVVAVVAFCPPPAVAQVKREEFEALKRDVEALKQQQAGQAAVLRELQEIKTLLRDTLNRLGRPGPSAEAPAPLDVVLSVAGLPAKGAAGATVALVEFTDYQ